MKSFISFISHLNNLLANQLPGLDAQLIMAPQVRVDELQSLHKTSDPKKSSVLILLYPSEDTIHTVFIERNKYDGVHSGQISFPGGQKEINDKSLIDTALREANEEINTDSKKVKVLGKLTSLYIPPSNFDVLPIVGYSEFRPDFKADKKEVNRIIEVRIKDLVDPGIIEKGLVWSSQQLEISAPYYSINSLKIWGATAMIASELIEIIKQIKEYSDYF